MSDQSYTTTFSVDRTADEVLAAINNPRAWWSEEIEGHTDQVDDVFTFRVKDIHYSEIQVIELVPDMKVVWRVLDNYMNYIDDQSEWKDTEIRFELFEKDGTTEVRFTHAGLVPAYECFEICSNAWGFYIGGSLRSLITTGEGKPSRNPDEVRYWEEGRVA
jgi:Activator of Hsp90 ATPase homolog 1-like protein